MAGRGYRSFLVRAWTREGQAVRVLVEDVRSGERTELRGARAARLIAEVESSFFLDAGGDVDSRQARNGAVRVREG